VDESATDGPAEIAAVDGGRQRGGQLPGPLVQRKELGMGRIVAAKYVTIDGVMEDPGGSDASATGGWSNEFWDQDLDRLQSEVLFASDALLLGRVTYERFAAAWPDMEHEQGPFAEKMNAMPKYVASRSLMDLTWNAKLIEGDIVEAVGRLKQDSGQKLLLYGSASPLRVLMDEDLVDRCRLMIHPTVLGSGAPLFSGVLRKTLRLVGTTTTSKGVVVLDYEPTG
jgi:dihydrofolate reductase